MGAVALRAHQKIIDQAAEEKFLLTFLDPVAVCVAIASCRRNLEVNVFIK